MNYLQLNSRFKWQAFAKKITLALLSLSAISYEATADTLTLPATIQAENYLSMKGISTAAAVDSGNGLYVGWTDAQDWVSFASTRVKIRTAGQYKITYRVASLEGGGSFIIRESNHGAVYDKVPIPSTGGWQKWVNVTRVVTLPSGYHTFGISVITSGFNINWFKIESMTTASSSSSTASSSKPASSKAASSAISSKATSSSPRVVDIVNNVVGGVEAIALQIAGPVGISWTAPKSRANGQTLDITQIGGYKIRYKLTSAKEFTYVTINDAWTNFYNFSWLEGNYIFQIATFDKDGGYSDYVNILKK
ncbi:MAG: carbohydrate-binding protein [Pseudomonadota bacterium]